MTAIIGDFDPTTLTWGPIAIAPVVINLVTAAPQPIYTVPAGKSFQVTSILIRGTTAITGAPQASLGTAGGGYTNILTPIPITSSLVSGQAMIPILPVASNAVIPAGGVINCVVGVQAVAGTSTIQLIGILF